MLHNYAATGTSQSLHSQGSLACTSNDTSTQFNNTLKQQPVCGQQKIDTTKLRFVNTVTHDISTALYHKMDRRHMRSTPMMGATLANSTLTQEGSGQEAHCGQTVDGTTTAAQHANMTCGNGCQRSAALSSRWHLGCVCYYAWCSILRPGVFGCTSRNSNGHRGVTASAWLCISWKATHNSHACAPCITCRVIDNVVSATHAASHRGRSHKKMTQALPWHNW